MLGIILFAYFSLAQPTGDSANLSDSVASSIALMTHEFLDCARKIEKIYGQGENATQDQVVNVVMAGTARYMIDSGNGDFKVSDVYKSDVPSIDSMKKNAKKVIDFTEKGNLVAIKPLFLFTLGEVGYLDVGLDIKEVEISQVLTGSTMLVRVGTKKGRIVDYNTYLMKGVNTSNFVDGTPFSFVEPLIVSGTYMYNTVSGASKKVFVLEPVDISVVKLAAKKLKAELAAKREQNDLQLKVKREAEEKAAKSSKMLAIDAKNTKAKEGCSKLISGLDAMVKRYKDSYSEKSESTMIQMQDQVFSYIKNSNKRLDVVVKDLNDSSLPEKEKAELIASAKKAVALAKEKIGLK